MDLSVYLYIAIGVVLVGVLIYRIVTREKRRRKKYLTAVLKNWGQIPNREYEYDEFQSIANYFKKTKGKEFTIDDITWNDLDMDSIFMSINNTQSSIGEEYLYKMLRTACFDKKTLDERNRVIEYFSRHEKERIDYQIDIAHIGRTKKISLYDYISNFAELENEGNFRHYLHILLIFVAIIILVQNPAFGILAVIFVLGYNIYEYFKTKSNIEPYFVCVGAVTRLIHSCEYLGKHNEPELKEYLDALRDGAKKLSSLKKDAKYIGSGDKLTGDLGEIVMDYIRMFTHLDIIKFNNMIGKVQKNIKTIRRLLETIGQLEAYIAIASYRECLPFYCRGDMIEGRGTVLEAKDMYHPLVEEPVANSIYEKRSVLLTGSNASGKSTFLKTTAICALLAQTIDTIPAHSYHSNFFRIYSSMALKDNLQGNESYYMVEIRSLKRIMDAAEAEGATVLCFVDEVLRGTNTVERIAASSRILQSLSQNGVMCFAATHDIELTQLLSESYSNYHFKEEIIDEDIIFNYRLNKGSATTRNAIKLLQIMGYEEDVIRKADQTAKHFLDTGIWEM